MRILVMFYLRFLARVERDTLSPRNMHTQRERGSVMSEKWHISYQANECRVCDITHINSNMFHLHRQTKRSRQDVFLCCMNSAIFVKSVLQQPQIIISNN